MERLIVALNKYWRPISDYYFWHKMDIVTVQNAVICSQFPKEVEDLVFEVKKNPFQIDVR